ncbi:Sec-independent protein translocase subunit TatA [Saccharomonospora sp. NPDC046836]|uniref:Sec-independent protein translocase subunit TatA n=1 Tax=Saccharomonospora sp. NPDC046836 TaxID=3156921 RepID=UPI0033FA446A
MGALQPWHLIILVLLVVLLFGAKRLPDAARSIGKSMKIFKAETKDMRESGDADTTTAEVETRQLPASTAPVQDSKDQQLAELQRQIDDLKKQQAPAVADQVHRNVS